MNSDILAALGGVGLFLIGMHMLSGGLRALAGDRLRALLARFTRTPLSGAATGAAVTALIQSSSATTVTAIGFVSAGLLTFSHALGIIFGANIGTTVTGWLVAILGFKLDLGQTVLPLVLVGALLQLLGRGDWARSGQALAGFSLLFIGIDAMKDGLEAFEGIVTPQDFPEDTVLGRLQLVGIGVLITLVTQSSSAGVATALAALGAGAISFPQAAALVIG
ncbi:Na/Pi cotransporter family protein, partial [Cribrihabitans sp. XS_ASV171]